MKIGFIGTGDFAKQHAKVITELGHEISSVYGTNDQKTDGFINEFGGFRVSNYEDIFGLNKPDALYIVIPPFAHDGVIESLAIDNMVPFLCEKPVGLNLNVCERIANRLKETKLVTASGFLIRAGSTMQEMKELVSKQKISQVRTYRGSGVTAKDYYRQMKNSGGKLVEQAIHNLDLMRYLVGEICHVSAFANYGILEKRFEGCDIYDSLEAIYQFENGAIGNIGTSDVMMNKANRARWIEIIGEDFYLIYEGDSFKIKNGQKDWEEIKSEGIMDKIKLHDQAFLNAVANNDQSLVTGDYIDAVKSLKLAIATVDSAQTNQTVEINNLLEA